MLHLRQFINKEMYVSLHVLLPTFRGCSFVSKSKMAEQSGAVAVFIADNSPDNADAMVDMVHDGTERVVHIPVGYLLGSDG